MSEEKRREAFLGRWSRRKQEHAKQEQAAPEAPPAAPRPAETGPAAPLPEVESLRTDSDFTPFMARDVTPETRRAALKRLFADAQFNVPDPFEPYSADLTGGEPIPEAMLKTLDHAKRLLFDEKQEVGAKQGQAEAQLPAQPQVEQTDPKDVARKQDA